MCVELGQLETKKKEEEEEKESLQIYSNHDPEGEAEIESLTVGKKRRGKERN